MSLSFTLKNMTNQKRILVVIAFVGQTLWSSLALSMGSSPPQEKPQPEVPAASAPAPLWEKVRSEGKSWTAHVTNSMENLGQDLLDVIPKDAATFCPKYANLNYTERKAFWTYLMSAMVRYESNFKPETSYTEDFKDSSGRYIVSRGLLQISLESSKGYACGFKTQSEIHDPLRNLDCGIRILDRWLGRDGRIAGKVGSSWQGGARYWSVLRSSSGSYNYIVKLMQTYSPCL